MMADDGGGDDVFVYMGGDQRVPWHVTHARVHESVKIITRRAFSNRRHLVSIEMHDGVELIEEGAFDFCASLRSINLSGVKVIERDAFVGCEVHGSALEKVEFGDKLDIIGNGAFFLCRSLRNIKIPKVRIIESCAFYACHELTEAELSEDLQSVGNEAFESCHCLRRITLPLKNNILVDGEFDGCDNLSQVDLVGGVHKAISSLHLESWRDEMNEEIGRINQVLPNTEEKHVAIKNWLVRVLQRIEHYKSEHYALLKGNMTQLELALWKSKLHEREGEEFSLSSDLCVLLEKKMTLLEFSRWKAKVDEEFAGARHEARVKCGANIIIPHVLSFLNDHDAFPLLRYDLATLRDWINS